MLRLSSFKFLFLILVVNGLVSCVGEVATSETEITKAATSTSSVVLSFDGIDDAVAIAHDKVEVYFSSPSGGSGDFLYKISVGDEPVPRFATEDTLQKDYRGFFRYLANDLITGTTYKIKVDVIDLLNNVEAITDSSKLVTTFSNEVTDFYGITSVANASGDNGVDSVSIRWVPASKDPSAPFGSNSDPASYEVILVDSTKQTPAAANDFTMSEADGRIVRTIEWAEGLNTSLVGSLESDREYFVFVRAIHKGSINSSSDPRLRSELNNRYLKIKTLSGSSDTLEYDTDTFNVSPGAGELALSNLNLTWDPIIGVYDHIRFYFSKSDKLPAAGSIDTSTCPALEETTIATDSMACKKLEDISLNQVIISDLNQLENYEIQLIVCISSDCSSKLVDSNFRCNFRSPASRCDARTEPVFASFNGITSVSMAENFIDLGNVYLNYFQPNFSSGYFDGYVVEYTTEKADLESWLADDSNPKPSTEILNDDAYAGVLTVGDYDTETSSQIVISNVDYSTGDDVCFSLYPFVYDGDGDMDFSQAGNLTRIWQCEQVQAIAPTVEDFVGFDSGLSVRENLTVTWSLPDKGVYSHYEVFYRKGLSAADTAFSFTDAIQDTTVDFDFSEYDRDLISSEVAGSARVSYTLSNLEDGRWIIGIRTYYLAGIGNVLRSEETTDLLFCDIDSTNPAAVNCSK